MRLSKDNTDQIRKRYNRIAFFYNILEAPMEWLRFGAWRPSFRKRVAGPRALEVGVGTGKNMPYYPAGVERGRSPVAESAAFEAYARGSHRDNLPDRSLSVLRRGRR